MPTAKNLFANAIMLILHHLIILLNLVDFTSFPAQIHELLHQNFK